MRPFSHLSWAAIDHVLVNQHFLDLRVKSEVRYDQWLSDHYLVTATWFVS